MSGGEANLIDLEQFEHNCARELFDKIKNESDFSRKKNLCNELVGCLVKHGAAEEQLFYPILGNVLNDRSNQSKGMSDHQQLNNLLKNMYNCSSFDKNFEENFSKCQKMVQDHIQLEESSMLPKFKERFNSDQLMHLGRLFKQLSDAASDRPDAPKSFSKELQSNVNEYINSISGSVNA